MKQIRIKVEAEWTDGASMIPEGAGHGSIKHLPTVTVDAACELIKSECVRLGELLARDYRLGLSNTARTDG